MEAIQPTQREKVNEKKMMWIKWSDISQIVTSLISQAIQQYVHCSLALEV